MLDLIVVHALIYILSLAESYLCVCMLMKWLFFHSDFPTNISIQLLIKNIHSLDELRMVRTFLSMIIHFIKSQVFFSFTQLSCFLFFSFFYEGLFSRRYIETAMDRQTSEVQSLNGRCLGTRPKNDGKGLGPWFIFPKGKTSSDSWSNGSQSTSSYLQQRNCVLQHEVVDTIRVYPLHP